MQSENYRRAQAAIAELKSAVLSLLEREGSPLTNAAIGRSLGIYGGHERHEGHISRTMLKMLEEEGVVEQHPDKSWSIRQHPKP